MKTFQELTQQYGKVKLIDFLYNHTPAFSTWVVKYGGWRVAMFYIDNEDLWAGWYPDQCMDVVVKSFTYDALTEKGVIEIE